MAEDYFSPQFPLNASEREIAIRRRVHRIAEFYQHLVVFVIIVAAMWAINAWQIADSAQPTKWHSWWALWPTLGWGIGVLTHGITVAPMWNFFSLDWEERKVKELLAREQK
jgi:amino acid transporter